MNKFDKIVIDSILKTYYDNEIKEQLTINESLINMKPINIVSYPYITTYPTYTINGKILAEQLSNENELNKTKHKLDLKLINILTNLVELYKSSGNVAILNQIELVLEEFIDNQQDTF